MNFSVLVKSISSSNTSHLQDKYCDSIENEEYWQFEGHNVTLKIFE